MYSSALKNIVRCYKYRVKDSWDSANPIWLGYVVSHSLVIVTIISYKSKFRQWRWSYDPWAREHTLRVCYFFFSREWTRLFRKRFLRKYCLWRPLRGACFFLQFPPSPTPWTSLSSFHILAHFPDLFFIPTGRSVLIVTLPPSRLGQRRNPRIIVAFIYIYFSSDPAVSWPPAAAAGSMSFKYPESKSPNDLYLLFISFSLLPLYLLYCKRKFKSSVLHLLTFEISINV